MPSPFISASTQRFWAASRASVEAFRNHAKLSYAGSASRCSHHIEKRCTSAQTVTTQGACVTIGWLKWHGASFARRAASRVTTSE